MIITKVLNNNAAIVIDENQQEQIAIGPGVGFKKGKGDSIIINKIEKLFVLKKSEKLQQLLLRIPEQHFILSNDIITYAEKQLNTELSEQILLVLTDHISFAIEREQKGIHLRNKFMSEIKVLYKREFEIGLWAIQHIKEKTRVELLIDEAAFIAFYIHTMNMKGGDLQEAVKQQTMIKDMIDSIKNNLQITIVENDVAYERFVTHLRFALTRTTSQYESYTMDGEMLRMIKRKFKQSFRCASKAAKRLYNEHDISMPEEELGYITIHLERLRQR